MAPEKLSVLYNPLFSNLALHSPQEFSRIMSSDSRNTASYTPRMCFSYFRSISVSCSRPHFPLLSWEHYSNCYPFYLLPPQPSFLTDSSLQPRNMLNPAHPKQGKIESLSLDSRASFYLLPVFVSSSCHNKIS